MEEKTLVILTSEYQAPVTLLLNDSQLRLIKFLQENEWLDEIEVMITDTKNITEI